MEARVRADYTWPVLRALEGREFVKSEWRPVPPGQEAEAARTAELELRESAIQSIAEPDAAPDADTPVLHPEPESPAEAIGEPASEETGRRGRTRRGSP